MVFQKVLFLHLNIWFGSVRSAGHCSAEPPKSPKCPFSAEPKNRTEVRSFTNNFRHVVQNQGLLRKRRINLEYIHIPLNAWHIFLLDYIVCPLVLYIGIVLRWERNGMWTSSCGNLWKIDIFFKFLISIFSVRTKSDLDGSGVCERKPNRTPK